MVLVKKVKVSKKYVVEANFGYVIKIVNEFDNMKQCIEFIKEGFLKSNVYSFFINKKSLDGNGYFFLKGVKEIVLKNKIKLVYFN